MPKTRTALTVALAGLLIAGGTGAASARPSATGPWIVKDLGQGRGSIAGHPTRSGPQDLASLIRTWGRPISLRLNTRQGLCTGTWRRPAAIVRLRNYGGGPPGTTLCSPKVGLISTITTQGPRWRTNRGLAIGASESRLTELYPSAFKVNFSIPGQSWGLIPFETVGIDGPVTVAGIYLTTKGGSVVSFLAPVGAEGE